MNSQFKFIELPLAGLFRVERVSIEDKRGFFSRFFCADEFKKIGLDGPLAQINHTLTKRKGVVRGMHFQYPPYAEAKIVGCIHGQVFDVAVDIRKSSKTFLQWHGEVLTDKNQTSLYIPEGFAHGFQTLTEDCQLIYLHSDFYSPNAEGALNACDSALAIDWPLEITETSDRDCHHPMLDSRFEGLSIL